MPHVLASISFGNDVGANQCVRPPTPIQGRHHPRLRKRFFMSLRVRHIFSMSLRGHPKEAAAISPSSVKYLQARGDCFTTFAMTWCPFVPTSTPRLRSLLRAQERSLTHCAPRNDTVKRDVFASPPKADNDHPWTERESFSGRTLFKTVLL